jgi:predicted metal-dependent phosphoesterase TrpH
MHTRHSNDSLSEPLALLDAAMEKGLGAIAVTDHDEIQGAIEAARMAQARKLPLQVIVGEEVGTEEGDLLVYFVKEKIQPGPLKSVLGEVKRQGAICCAAHPYDAARHGIALEKLPKGEIALIDAVEAFNARASLAGQNASALLFSQKSGKPPLAGSDAHHPSEVGAAYVEFEGVDALDRRNILAAKRKIGGFRSSPLVHFFSRYAWLRKKIAALFK